MIMNVTHKEYADIRLRANGSWYFDNMGRLSGWVGYMYECFGCLPFTEYSIVVRGDVQSIPTFGVSRFEPDHKNRQ